MPVVDRLSKDAKFGKVDVFKVDFDSSKELLKRWKVTYQATLIAFKGKTEKTRMSAETDPAAIQKVFEAAL